MNKTSWFVFGIVCIIGLLLLFGGGMMSGWGYRGWGMTGPGMMGWGYPPSGGTGSIFTWLIPVGIIVLVALAIAWLVRNFRS